MRERRLLTDRLAVDRRIGFGRPTLRRKGVKVSTIADRVAAGERRGDVASDYGISVKDVIAAESFEAGRRWADGERAAWNGREATDGE